MREEYFIVSLDHQIGRWLARAKHAYGVETFPKALYVKILMGARSFLRAGDVPAARAFVYRQISKRWQYLHSERIEEFIEEEYGPFPNTQGKA